MRSYYCQECGHRMRRHTVNFDPCPKCGGSVETYKSPHRSRNARRSFDAQFEVDQVLARLDKIQEELDGCLDDRDEAMRDALAAGATYEEIGAAAKLSHGGVYYRLYGMTKYHEQAS